MNAVRHFENLEVPISVVAPENVPRSLDVTFASETFDISIKQGRVPGAAPVGAGEVAAEGFSNLLLISRLNATETLCVRKSVL